MSLELQIARYLDGELEGRAAAEVETALADPATARLLSEELMVRELLATIPPQGAPEALLARLEASLGVSDTITQRVISRLRGGSKSAAAPERATGLGARALATARVGVAGARLAATGVSTVRRSAELVSDLSATMRSRGEPKPLWRRAASLLFRRGK